MAKSVMHRLVQYVPNAQQPGLLDVVRAAVETRLLQIFSNSSFDKVSRDVAIRAVRSECGAAILASADERLANDTSWTSLSAGAKEARLTRAFNEIVKRLHRYDAAYLSVTNCLLVVFPSSIATMCSANSAASMGESLPTCAQSLVRCATRMASVCLQVQFGATVANI